MILSPIVRISLLAKAALLTVAVLVLVAGCTDDGGDPTSAPAVSPPTATSAPTAAPDPTAAPAMSEPVHVVTTTNIVADWVTNIGGDHVNVFSVLPVGADPHGYQPGARDVAQIADADLVLSIGLGLEASWLRELLENAARDPSTIVELGESIDPIEFAETHIEDVELLEDLAHVIHEVEDGEISPEEGIEEIEALVKAFEAMEEGHDHEDEEEGEHHGDEDEEEGHDHEDEEEGEHHGDEDEEEGHDHEDEEEGEHHGDEDEEEGHDHEDEEEGEHHGDEDEEEGHDHGDEDHADEGLAAMVLEIIHEVEDGEMSAADAIEAIHHMTEEGEDAHAGHGHGLEDPHFWFDPLRVKVAVDEIVSQLSALDPDNAGVFSANASAYKEQLDELHTWTQSQVDVVPQDHRLLVTSHDSLGYFALLYGFEVAGVILSFTTEVEPSAEDLAHLAETIKDLGVPAVFGETTVSERLAASLATETGAQLVRLYSGSLGQEGSEAETYIGMVRTNVSRITEALK